MRDLKRLSHSPTLAAILALGVVAGAGCGRQPVDLLTPIDQANGDGGRGDGPGLKDGGDSGPDTGLKDIGPPGGDGGSKIIDLIIQGSTDALPVGGTRMFSAIARFADGSMADVSQNAIWSSNNPMVIAIQGGTVKAIAPGDAQITAMFGGLTRGVTLHVTGMTSLVSISVTPAFSFLTVGQVVQFTAIGTFSDGTTQDVTNMVTWSSSDPNVARTMGPTAQAVGSGQATITASLANVQGTARISVNSATLTGITVGPPSATVPINGRVQFQAIGQLSDGTVVDLTLSAMWASLDPMLAQMDQTGVATGVSAGMVTITASFMGFTGRAVLTVTPAMLIKLSIEPVNPTVSQGTRIQFHVIAFFSDGTSSDVTSASSFTSSNAQVVQVDSPTAIGTALSPGTADISATFSGLTATTTVTVTQAALVSLTITPNPATVGLMQTTPLRAIGTFSDGSMQDVTVSVTWSSDNPNTVAVSNSPGSNGVVTGLQPGSANVTATFQGVSASVLVTVSNAPLVSISIQPPSLTMPVNVTQPVRAIGTFADGSMRDITNLVSWSSANPMVADVGPGGLVHASSAGVTTITAMFMGVSAQAQVTVTAGGVVSIVLMPANAQTTTGLRTNYIAIATFSDGTMLDVTHQATWTTDDGTVATVSNIMGAEGQLTAQGPGTTNVHATFMGITGTTSVTVVDPQIIQIQISPIAPTLFVGQPIRFTCRAIFSNGTSRNITNQVQWSTSNSMVIDIMGNGFASANGPGTAQITATFMGLSDSTPVTVSGATIVQIQISPIDPSIPVGSSVQSQAVAIFSDGSSRNVTPLATFMSSDQTVAQVSVGGRGPGGRATGIAAGMAQITATFMGLSGTTNITVTSAVVTAISISPPTATLPVGTTQQYQATAIYSDGTSMNVTQAATWFTVDQTVAQITNGRPARGQLTAIGPGMTAVTATFMGVMGMAEVTVTSATITQIQVTPFDRSVAAGEPVQYQAVAIYSDGTSMTVTGQATWQSSNTSVAQISNGFGSRGQATTLAAGMTTISATFMGSTGSANLTVTSATITQIQVTPFDSRVPAGFSERLTATAIYSDGTTQNITQLATWQSSDTSIAPVTTGGARGNVSALMPGMVTISVTYMGSMGSTSFTVTSATLTRIDVTPQNSGVMAGGTLQLTATGTFSDGSTLDLTNDVTWTSSNPMIADVSNANGSHGLASGFTSGTVTITAERGMVNGTTQFSVR